MVVRSFVPRLNQARSVRLQRGSIQYSNIVKTLLHVRADIHTHTLRRGLDHDMYAESAGGMYKQKTRAVREGQLVGAVGGGAGEDGLTKCRGVGKEGGGFCLEVVLSFGQVEFGGDGRDLCVCGRVKAVGGSCTGSKWGGGFAVTLFLDHGRDLAIELLALDDDQRVAGLGLAIVDRGEHVVENNGTQGQLLGCDEQSLTQGCLRCQQLDKLVLNRRGAYNNIARWQRQDSFIGKQFGGDSATGVELCCVRKCESDASVSYCFGI